MNSYLLPILRVLGLLLLFNLSLYAFVLTDQEKEWIKMHPLVTVGIEKDWPPFDFADQNNTPQGFSVDILQYISETTGVTFAYDIDEWHNLIAKAKTEKLDLLPALYRTPQREEFLSFTPSYFSVYEYFFVHSSLSVRSLKELDYKTAAIPKGYGNIVALKNRYPKINILEVDTLTDAIHAVLNHDADLLVDSYAVLKYKFQQLGVNSIKPLRPFRTVSVYMAVTKRNKILHSIITKALSELTLEMKDEQMQKWENMSHQREARKLHLSLAERKWIELHPHLVFGGDYKWVPFEFRDEQGNHAGIAADFMQIIRDKTGLDIEMKLGVWSEILQAAKEGKLDGLSCAVLTRERKHFFYFTSPYVEIDSAVIIQKERKEINDIDDLLGKRVAVNKSSYMYEWLQEHYPKIRLLGTHSNEEAIEAVSYGKADAYIGNIIVANYVMQKNALTNLKIVSKLQGKKTQTAVATSRSEPLLASIMQKVIESITEEEKDEILQRWFHYVEHKHKAVTLTEAEEKWLSSHKRIAYTGYPDWLPYEAFTKKGRHEGIIANYLREIEAILPLTFSSLAVKTRREAVRLADREEADVISGDINERRLFEHYRPLDPFLHTPIVIVMKEKYSFLKDLDELDPAIRIGVVKGYGYTDRIVQKYRQFSFREFEKAEKLLGALISGDLDAALLTLPKATYTIESKGLNNLNIVGKLPIEAELTLFVRKNMQELYTILNKALSYVNREKKNKIVDEWFRVKFSKKINYRLAFAIAGVSALFLLLFFYWNRKLAKEIEERKVLESELRKSQRQAESANEAKSIFLANISHEIRTPINAIIGFSQLLYERIDEYSLKKYTLTIQSASRLLLNLINDILDISKIEAGKIEIQRTPTDIYALCDKIYNIFELEIEKKGLAFKLHIDKDVPSLLLLDETRVHQILLNLIGNAVKFTDEGFVELTITLGNENTQQGTVDLLIQVKDSGIGVKQDQFERIFKSFEQQEGQDNKRYGGTGLGLHISRRLAEAMEGELTAVSDEGCGAVFILFLYDVEVLSSKEVQKDMLLEKQTDRKKKELPLVSIDRDLYPQREEILEGIDLLETLHSEVSKSNNLDEIAHFSNALLVFSKAYRVEALTTYAKELRQAVESFDIAEIQRYLPEFSQYLKALKKVLL